MQPRTLHKRLLAWFDQYGRHDLPWQRDRSPYRVWVSEIMLQQTQVTTVVPYYERFIRRFPDVQQLAAADIDEVLHLWTGLGYYSRARNLHRAALEIMTEHHAEFPADLDQLMTLPGIGRSTAAAILAQAFEQPAAILDGNVKRVLCRLHAVTGWPGDAAVQKQLWSLAEQYTPRQRIRDYTQAIMDLGATVCTRTKPRCSQCPLRSACAALAGNSVDQFPQRKPRKQLPEKSTTMLMLQSDAGILLEQRPPTGIWGGLWSFPELNEQADIQHHCAELFGCQVESMHNWQPVRHTFSHFHLDIKPLYIRVKPVDSRIMDCATLLWYNVRSPQKLGLAAPVKQFLQRLEN
jgi:A/G-specific adenine glycosylase